MSSISSPSPFRVVFVVGCPRSGTTWMAQLLNQHPAVALFEHSKFFRYLRTFEIWWQRKERPRPVPVISQGTLYRLCREMALGVLQAVAQGKPAAHVVVDKTPENVHESRFILQLLPDAHFIHVVRDPRGVFSSMRHAHGTFASEFPSRPLDGATFWRRDVEKGLEIAKATDRYLEVRYETLCSRGAEELERVLHWLDLATDSDRCREAVQACSIEELRKSGSKPEGFFRRGESEGWREELSEFEIRVIELAAGDLMRQLGYPCIKKPLRRKPLRIGFHEGTERFLAFVDQSFNRLSRAVLRRWRGRERALKEVF